MQAIAPPPGLALSWHCAASPEVSSPSDPAYIQAFVVPEAHEVPVPRLKRTSLSGGAGLARDQPDDAASSGESTCDTRSCSATPIWTSEASSGFELEALMAVHEFPGCAGQVSLMDRVRILAEQTRQASLQSRSRGKALEISQAPQHEEAASNEASERALTDVLKACVKSCAMENVHEIFAGMVAEGRTVPVGICNKIMRTCEQLKDVRRVKFYMDYLRHTEAGPDVMSYNIILNVSAGQGSHAEMAGLLVDMWHRGIKPTMVTFGTICKAFARSGNVEGVDCVIKMVQDSGETLNEYFYASLISACSAADPPQPDRAEKAVFEMVKQGLRPHCVKRALSRVVSPKRVQDLMQAVRGRRC